jgi:hypothetical protein
MQTRGELLYVEGNMATMIFLFLCLAGVGFLLYCLFHFTSEMKQPSQHESHKCHWSESPKSNIVPLQLVEPTSIGFWSEGTWGHILYVGNNSGSTNTTGQDSNKEGYDKAA